MWTSHKQLLEIVAGILLPLLCNQSPSFTRASQGGHDDPWNPQYIDHLPKAVRSAVIGMCEHTPRAAHDFANLFG